MPNMLNRLQIYISISICFVIAKLNLTNGVTVYGSCITPSGQRASCIDLQDCKYLYDLMQNPNLSAQNRNYLAASQCGYRNNNVQLCCPFNYRNSPGPVVPTNGGTDLLPKPPQCGVDISDRILGGVVTKVDEFPWMALIEYTKPGNVKGHHCGGTLINNLYVVTAAHCVIGPGIPSDWRLTGVRLGEWNTTTNPDCEYDINGKAYCVSAHVDVGVVRTIPHPQYEANQRRQLNDIALLRLTRSVTITDFIKPICLPSQANLRDEAFVGTSMDVAGWGKTEAVSVSDVKLKADVSVWNLEDCRRTYTRQNIRPENSQMCAGGVEGVDSCRGDSGGPLVSEQRVNGRSYFFLIGVVSFGPTPCGLPGWPGVYTRVGAYIDWIEQTVTA